MSFTLSALLLMNSPEHSLFALVDGLQFERYFGNELEVQQHKILPLFDKYPDSRIAFAGPWIMQMNHCMAEWERLNELEAQYPAVSWLLSRATLQELVTHFQNVMNVMMPDGKVALMRLQDPRVQIRMGELLDDEQHHKLTRLIDEWLSLSDGRIYSLKKKDFIC
ncbi:DUF4123 domain-containing protein [Enterobacter cloacae complex sp. ECC445]|uniref:DUF4123 domain-containing protein n=1 Tax=Enterobacter cloacae complex TaxID=354276 RepID=UPI00097CAF06|nr:MULTISPECIES: DUF4123 domain-containing protein [Enterobacter cloacae complex]GJL42781.1 hypothetical protein TUM17577_39900 [Enterobacter asburiae]MBT1935478.1 DUF4123 domain-containing protein [Enterobacter chengduensis]MBT1963938.1 DUF4123 domain-containing protein [Enterobacter chengduensis]MCG0457411.1 DUF4123 domain-containing protein [Enterobacter cloacae complex sp. ECC445]MCK6820256.1 DUF4123 domain-containing protein [Enterobacter chengduensis]